MCINIPLSFSVIHQEKENKIVSQRLILND